MVRPARCLLQSALAIGFLGSLVLAPVAQAVLLPSDLSASASVSFDSGFASDPVVGVSGSGSQTGSMSITAGAASATTTYSGASAVGDNPLARALTETGNGLAFGGTATAGPALGRFGTGVDFFLDIDNNSATNSYRVTFSVRYDNRVDSAGPDAFADSLFSISDDGGATELFFTDIISDTFFGNSVGGVDTGASGGPLAEAGTFTFSLDVAPGDFIALDGFWTVEGGALAPDSTASSFFDVFVSIDNVELLNQPPNPTPVPGTLALLALGLAGFAARRGLRRVPA